MTANRQKRTWPLYPKSTERRTRASEPGTFGKFSFPDQHTNTLTIPRYAWHGRGTTGE